MSSKLEKNVAWEQSIRGFLYKQLWVSPKPIPSTVSLAGKTAIITGANGGLGFEAGAQLLQLGLSRLIMAVRSQAKGDAAAEKLKGRFPDAEINVSILDMADYDSIVAFTKRCRDLDRIDYAILNAGLQSATFERNEKTGHEAMFQVNYLSNVFLLLLLESTMKDKRLHNNASEPPVISVIGSDTMYFSKLGAVGPIFPRMDDLKSFGKLPHYADSKMLLMMFISRLAEQTNPDDVIINVPNPGMTAGTSLGQEEKPGFAARRIFPLVAKLLGRSVPTGASVYVHALLIEGRESHGSFVSEWAIKPYAGILYKKEGREMAERLWQETMEELRFASNLGIDIVRVPQ
ncbi:hypothetical protein AK830_g12090 [Neonectria ditissima]|uniref:Uncharacterized protein n=1 Tax=Neonectria ditissima TaxID=78410 RepID=A0A0P7ABE8_9HYPO|nr:hypothetical protein AK830_g12090 [Neonectria ditissima]